MRRLRRTRRALVVVTAVVAGCAGGAGCALVTGRAEPEATPAPVPVSITVNQTSVVTGLVPGGAPQPLWGTFDNPSREPVVVRDVTATVVGTDVPACDPSNFAISGSVGRVGEISAGPHSGRWSGLSIELVDDARINQSDCEGARVDIRYTSS